MFYSYVNVYQRVFCNGIYCILLLFIRVESHAMMLHRWFEDYAWLCSMAHIHSYSFTFKWWCMRRYAKYIITVCTYHIYTIYILDIIYIYIYWICIYIGYLWYLIHIIIIINIHISWYGYHIHKYTYYRIYHGTIICISCQDSWQWNLEQHHWW
jgi:hypothetical protein